MTARQRRHDELDDRVRTDRVDLIQRLRRLQAAFMSCGELAARVGDVVGHLVPTGPQRTRSPLVEAEQFRGVLDQAREVADRVIQFAAGLDEGATEIQALVGESLAGTAVLRSLATDTVDEGPYAGNEVTEGDLHHAGHFFAPPPSRPPPRAKPAPARPRSPAPAMPTNESFDEVLERFQDRQREFEEAAAVARARSRERQASPPRTVRLASPQLSTQLTRPRSPELDPEFSNWQRFAGTGPQTQPSQFPAGAHSPTYSQRDWGRTADEEDDE